jgi:tetratricopeptide (TPR) repeat protein
MKKLLPILLLSVFGIQAQNMNEFKKNLDNANAKYKIKSYALALTDYDNAIKLIQPEVDKLIKDKKLVSDANRFLVEPYVKRAACFYFTGKGHLMGSDLEKVALLDTANADAKALKAYNVHKSGDKINGCRGMKKQAKAGSEIGAKLFEDCFCWSEGHSAFREGESANKLKKYDEALKKLEIALDIFPDSGKIHAEIGRSYFGKGQDETALKYLNKAIELTQKNANAYSYRAQILLKLNKLDSAFDDITHSINLNPKNYDNYVMRAEICEEQQKWSSAIYDLNECIRLQPERPDNYYKIGEIKLNHLSDPLSACEYYKKACARGYEPAATACTNCDDPKWMKKHMHKDKK